MLKRHLVASTRRLLRERSYALTNIVGLALGLASFLTLVLFMEFELGYDRHHLGHEDIYRLATEVATGDDIELLAVTSRPLGPLLKESFPEVVDFARVERSSFRRQVLRSQKTAMYWDNVLLADPSIFRVLSHRVIYGDPESALVDPLSIAISERVSRAYFGDRNPIGETLEAETSAYRISLVFEELPANSHMRYDVLLSYNRIAAFAAADPPPITEQLWQSPPNYTYVVMEPGYDPRQFATVSSRFYEQYMAGTNAHDDRSMRFYLEPLADIHHYSETYYDWPSGNRYHVLAIATVAFFVLCVACINYVNLATARSTRLSREVGMRKLHSTWSNPSFSRLSPASLRTRSCGCSSRLDRPTRCWPSTWARRLCFARRLCSSWCWSSGLWDCCRASTQRRSCPACRRPTPYGRSPEPASTKAGRSARRSCSVKWRSPWP